MLTELELKLARSMVAAQAGDAAEYRILLAGCVPVIAAAVRAQGFRGDAVDDVVQDTLLAVHRARHTYDPARPFLPWLRAIARRRSVDALRRRGRQPGRAAAVPGGYDSIPDPAEAADSRLEAQDRRRQLASALRGLPQAQRQAVEQLAMAERSLEDTAQATGRSKGALKVNLHRAIKALRARLTGEPAGDDPR
ncbi:sigma-70 family RNA polymerase sigma factor [Roseomonas sp. 18066]|uniref:sigma-70 family RNA polymerase sigma factor n=1 Tax=Roseomonas sp. 18066 TaxID=2681412 RepID=UPI00190F1EA1|nr:sigma-70 family RNA polymerase sigma factor [Roseomonas sp. 18066]